MAALTSLTLVRAALRLRAWALRVLAGDAGAAPPDAPAEAWRLFLAVERCALPLHARLRGAGAAGDDAAALIRGAATEELQRVMSARRQMQMLGALAARRGWRAVVLKGGVPAAAGGADAAVDLADVDVLVPPADAAPFAAALDALGYAAAGHAAAHHLEERDAPDALPVEVHTTLHHDGAPAAEALWARAEPLGGAPGLERLAAGDHLWHALTHSALDHPHRRGRLRDLLLIAGAASACGPGELAEARARAAAHPEHAALLGAVLALAESLGTAPAPAPRQPPADAFARVAAANYLFHALEGRRGIGALLPGAVEVALFALVGDPADRRRLWAAALGPAPPPTHHRPLTRLERAAPRLGSAVRVAARWRRLAVAGALAGASAVLGRLGR